MLMTYGRGRAEQLRLHPPFGSAPIFAPPLFVVYLILTAVALLAAPGFGRILLAPLLLYVLALLGQAAALSRKAPLARCFSALPLIILTHLLYGWGFWRGLMTK